MFISHLVIIFLKVQIIFAQIVLLISLKKQQQLSFPFTQPAEVQQHRHQTTVFSNKVAIRDHVIPVGHNLIKF